jgi:protein-disulfide isomerase
MFRSFSVLLASLLCFSLAGTAQSPKKSALDKATMEAYVRHLFVLDSHIKVEVRDPKPSTELPGFMDVTVHAAAGNASQDWSFLVSKDGSKILQATVLDVNNNPFKADLDKLKTEFAPSFGTPGASVVIVAFSDFECPYCREEAQMLRQNLLTAYPTQVRLYFKDFPLTPIHPWAGAAAMAGRCVFRQSPAAFWNYHDWAFAHQEEITKDNFSEKVMEWTKGEKDLDAVQLTRCIDSKETEAEVNRTIAQGDELGIHSTPTLFVNGRRIAQTIDWTNLRGVIDYEIEYQKTAKDAGEDCGCDLKLNVPGLQEQKALPLLKK